jgi:hypothetical protein
MERFDLKRALAGEPLITRGGIPASGFRKNCVDGTLPYIADVGEGDFWWYAEDGTAPDAGKDGEFDLFMLQETFGDASDSSATSDSTTSIATGTPVESGSLSKMLEHRHDVRLEWSEPWQAESEFGDDIHAHIKMSATVHDCINSQRRYWTGMGMDHRGMDRDLLLDFMALYFAGVVR